MPLLVNPSGARDAIYKAMSLNPRRRRGRELRREQRRRHPMVQHNSGTCLKFPWGIDVAEKSAPWRNNGGGGGCSDRLRRVGYPPIGFDAGTIGGGDGRLASSRRDATREQATAADVTLSVPRFRLLQVTNSETRPTKAFREIMNNERVPPANLCRASRSATLASSESFRSHVERVVPTSWRTTSVPRPPVERVLPESWQRARRSTTWRRATRPRTGEQRAFRRSFQSGVPRGAKNDAFRDLRNESYLEIFSNEANLQLFSSEVFHELRERGVFSRSCRTTRLISSSE